MENDQVFAADAALQIPASKAAPPRYHGDTARAVATAANGGAEAHKDADYENTPLLSRDPDDDYGAPAPRHQDDEDRGPPKWSGERDFEGQPWWNKPSVYWLLPPFLIYTLAWGGVIVPRLNLILNLICDEYLSDRSLSNPSFSSMPVIFGIDNPQCQIPEVQALVSRFTLYGNLIAGILSAITSPKLGAISDRFGRRKIIALPTLGMLVGEIATILAAKYPDMVSVNWLFLGYACEGLCGSFIVAMAVTNAYASDCTAPPQRNVTFAYFHGCLFTGIALGPLIAGYIVKATGQILTIFYIALACHLFFLSFLLFVVPESLTKERQMAAREKHRLKEAGEHDAAWTNNPMYWALSTLNGAKLFAPLKILYPTGEGSSRALRRNLLLLAAVDATIFGVAMGSVTIVIIYSEIQFGWGTFETSIFVSIVNTCRVGCLIIVLPLVTYLVRGRQGNGPQCNSGSDRLDLAIIRISILFDIIGYVGYATVRTGALLKLCGAIAAIGGMGAPTLSSALTKHVPADRTGQLLGATGLLHALAKVVAPTIFNLIYSVTVFTFKQTVFVCLAATFGVAFIISWFIKPDVYFDEPEVPISRPADGSDEEEVSRD